MKVNEELIGYIENSLKDENPKLKDAVNLLIKNYNKNAKRLATILKQADKQQLILKETNEQLNDYKENLEKKVEEEIEKRKENEKVLIQQSKLAAMGEMIDAVAHQWKQPLNVISMKMMMLDLNFELGEVDDTYIKNLNIDIKTQIDHMVNTLDEFRGFLRPNKELKEFSLIKMINSVLLLVQDELIKNKIETKILSEVDFNILGVENEFKHIILNIINNAKDAFMEKDIKDREITFNIYDSDTHIFLKIEDNAGGIPEDVIDDIFKPNVTTKEEGKGTGIGLYMSLQIAQKHNGDISVENINNGAKFTIKVLKS